MKKGITLLLFVFVSFLSACTSRKEAMLLAQVAEVVDSNPQLALDLLDTVNDSTLSTKRSKAEYALQYIKASDNLGRESNSELVKEAFQYYKSRKPLSKQAYVWYVTGKVQMNEGNLSSALMSFMKAQSASSSINDALFQAKLYQAMGDAYSRSFLYDEALVHYEYSAAQAGQTTDTTLWLESVYAEARTFNNLKQYYQADSVFRFLFRQNLENHALFHRIIADYALMAVEQDHDYILGQILYNKAVSENRSFGSFNHWGAYAYALEQTGNHEEADMLLKQMEEKKVDSVYSTLVWKSRIMAHRSNFSEAYELLDRATAVRSDNIRATLRKSALRAHSEYYAQAYENARRKMRLTRFLITLVFLLLMAGIHIVFSVYRRKKKASRLREISLLETTCGLSNQLDELQKERLSLQEHFVKIHQANLKVFGSLLKTTLGADESNIDAKQILLYEKARETMDTIVADKQGESVFENQLNACFDNAMYHLRKELPNHTDDYYRFAGFVFAGFDNETLMAITGTKSIDSIYAKKRRLKQDILHSRAEHKSLFLQLIS